MSKNSVLALPHTIVKGDAMTTKKKSYELEFILVEDRTDEICRVLAKKAIEKVLAKHGAIIYNLDEILTKYISEETHYDHKGR